MRKHNRRGPAAFNTMATGYVLRGDEADELTRRAHVDNDLVLSPFAGVDYADPRLVDPRMNDLVEEARAEARALGYDDGRAEGYEDGRIAGLEMMANEIEKMKATAEADREQVRAEYEQLRASVTAAVDRALQYQLPLVEELRDLVANLAVDIAEELVGHHLVVGDCAAVDAVRRALDQVPRRIDVVLRVSPTDLASVRDYVGGLIDHERFTVVADPDVPHGDAIAEADNLEVTVALAEAVESVRKVLHP